ncbi:MAG: DUF1134 domain-containing protein [Sphingomonadales bacterium]|nr:DUF1134 domain-containing protein [Sphingomonadales bacterium]
MALPGVAGAQAAGAQAAGAQAIGTQPSGGAGIDSDLVRPGAPATPPVSPPAYTDPTAQPRYQSAQPAPITNAVPVGPAGCTARFTGKTYQQDDLIAAAESVFGKGAQGLAVMIRDVLSKQGEPNGYIAGREASGAIAVGLRYGSGMMCSKVVGRMPVYWTGPSVGFDFGANAARTMVLVYNLNNADDLFHRFVAGEGQAYLVGGFHVSYLRHGNVVLIPVRMGVGLRLGVNGGYMKVTRKLNYLPF